MLASKKKITKFMLRDIHTANNPTYIVSTAITLHEHYQNVNLSATQSVALKKTL
jgi:hypothetical protein